MQTRPADCEMPAMSESVWLHNLFLAIFPEMSWSNVANYSMMFWKREHAVHYIG